MNTSAPIPARGKGFAALAASAATLLTAGLLLAPALSQASSHREAPLIANDPAVDNTDLYAFVSPDNAETVTLIANWSPFEEPNGGPNFYPFSDDARYEIHVDNNGDAKPDITYRWTFETEDQRGTDTFLYNNGPVNSLDDATLLFKQTYTLEKVNGEQSETLVDNGRVAPSFVGAASMPNYATLRDEAVVATSDGGRAFAGQADDPFFLDLRVFDLLYGTDLSETGQDTLSGYNVNAVALQVPKASLLGDGDDPVIGVWTTTSRQSIRTQNADGTQEYTGDHVQISRLGNPLVNEVVIPAGLKDAFNSLKPENDASVQPAVDRVNDPEVPKLIEKIYGIPAPAAPRDDLFSVFLTGVEGLNKPQGEVQPAELLRLNTSIAPASAPDRLGVLAKDTAGFPNGRRLTDDVVDIGIQALEGAVRTGQLVEALAAGDGVNENDVAFGEAFPYLALPHGDAVNSGASGAGGAESANTSGATPSGGVAAGAGGTAGRDFGSTAYLAAVLGFAGIALAIGAAFTLRRAVVRSR